MWFRIIITTFLTYFYSSFPSLSSEIFTKLYKVELLKENKLNNMIKSLPILSDIASINDISGQLLLIKEDKNNITVTLNKKSKVYSKDSKSFNFKIKNSYYLINLTSNTILLDNKENTKRFSLTKIFDSSQLINKEKELTVKINELNDKSKALINSNMKLKLDNDSIKIIISNLKKQLSNLEKSSDLETKKLTKKVMLLQNKLISLNEKNVQKEEIKKEAFKNSENLKDEIVNLGLNNEKLAQDVKILEDKLSKAKNFIKENETLKSLIETLKKNNKILENKNKANQEALVNDRQVNLIKKLESKNISLKSDLKKLKKDYNDTLDKLSNFENRLSKFKEESNDKIKILNKDYKNKIADLENKIKKLSADVSEKEVVKKTSNLKEKDQTLLNNKPNLTTNKKPKTFTKEKIKLQQANEIYNQYQKLEAKTKKCIGGILLKYDNFDINNIKNYHRNGKLYWRPSQLQPWLWDACRTIDNKIIELKDLNSKGEVDCNIRVDISGWHQSIPTSCRYAYLDKPPYFSSILYEFNDKELKSYDEILSYLLNYKYMKNVSSNLIAKKTPSEKGKSILKAEMQKIDNVQKKRNAELKKAQKEVQKRIKEYDEKQKYKDSLRKSDGNSYTLFYCKSVAWVPEQYKKFARKAFQAWIENDDYKFKNIVSSDSTCTVQNIAQNNEFRCNSFEYIRGANTDSDYNLRAVSQQGFGHLFWFYAVPEDYCP